TALRRRGRRQAARHRRHTRGDLAVVRTHGTVVAKSIGECRFCRRHAQSVRKMARRLTFCAAALVSAACLIPLAATHAAGAGLLEPQPDGHGGQSYTVPVQVLLLMTGLAFLPALLLTTTAFTRIIIVLSLLRQALGLTQTPPNQVLIGLALFLTIFVMGPV